MPWPRLPGSGVEKILVSEKFVGEAISDFCRFRVEGGYEGLCLLCGAYGSLSLNRNHRGVRRGCFRNSCVSLWAKSGDVPFLVHWKQSPLWTLCRFSSSVKVARARVRPMSMALGFRLLSAFLHCGFVAPPRRSPPLTLSFRKMYSCWWWLAARVQSFQVTGWSNFTQFATSL